MIYNPYSDYGQPKFGGSYPYRQYPPPQPTYPSQSRYSQPPGYPPQSEYAQQPRYPPQSEYAQQPRYPPQSEYAQQPGYAPSSQYPSSRLHPHPLIFKYKPSWRCDICGQHFSNTSSYNCYPCDFDVCSRCYQSY